MRADAARGAPEPAARTTRARRPSRVRRGWSRSCSSRRSTTARSRSTPARRSAAARSLPRPLPPEGAAGTAATVKLLERIPGAQVTELDAGCCGMAGSFGFEAEHYDLSMQIGEMRLFPALRGQRRDPGRRDRGVVPPADRPRGGAAGLAPGGAGEGGAGRRATGEGHMSNELISIIVLIAVFLIATTLGINMGVLGHRGRVRRSARRSASPRTTSSPASRATCS